MKQGLVMSIKRNKAVILTKSGAFEEIRLKKNSQLAIGDELQPHHIFTFSVPKIKIWYPVFAACLAVVLFFVTTSGIFQKDAVAAYISLDINPSIEAGINNHMQIVSVKALNQDASDLLNNPQTYKHKSLQAFLNDIMTRLQNKGYLSNQPDILVTSAFNQKLKNKNQFEKEVQQAVDYISKTQGLEKSQGNVTYVKTTIKNRDKAAKAGVSTGKYLVYLNESKKDPNISLDKVKKLSIKEIKTEMHEKTTINLIKSEKNKNKKPKNNNALTNKAQSADNQANDHSKNNPGQSKNTDPTSAANEHTNGKNKDNGNNSDENIKKNKNDQAPNEQSFNVGVANSSNDKIGHGKRDNNHGNNNSSNNSNQNSHSQNHQQKKYNSNEHLEKSTGNQWSFLTRMKELFNN